MLTSAAEESLAQAEFSFDRQAWNLVIRRCQEAVELSLSGLLVLMGVDYPKDHDQAPLVVEILTGYQIPIDTISTVKLQEISIDLSRKRGPALHQEEGYDKSTAQSALEDSKKVMKFAYATKKSILAKINRS
jgi:HEPN domain-containing protein